MTRLTGVVPPASWTVVMAVSLTAVAATAVLGTGLAVHGYRVAAAGRGVQFHRRPGHGHHPTRNAWRASGSQDPALLQKGQRDGSR